LQRTGDGEEIVKIVDFGIAQLKPSNEEAAKESTHRRLTRTGMIFGTPEYMAPEQAAARAVDHRTDLYALCAVLYRCLASRAPFVDESLMALVHRAIHEMPPRPSRFARVSADAEAFLAVGLSKRPEERYESGHELAEALALALDDRLPVHLKERAQSVLSRTPWSE
jgi:eukaryotic-like serine/threonine-protein kinase